MRLAVLFLLASAVLPSVSRAQVPVFAITKENSAVNFSVKASVSLEGVFDKWDDRSRTLRLMSPREFWT